jgi:hypothetical protein
MWTLPRTNSRFRRLFLSGAVSSFRETAVYLSLAIRVRILGQPGGRRRGGRSRAEVVPAVPAVGPGDGHPPDAAHPMERLPDNLAGLLRGNKLNLASPQESLLPAVFRPVLVKH